MEKDGLDEVQEKMSELVKRFKELPKSLQLTIQDDATQRASEANLIGKLVNGANNEKLSQKDLK